MVFQQISFTKKDIEMKRNSNANQFMNEYYTFNDSLDSY